MGLKTALRLEIIGDNFIQHRRLLEHRRAPMPHLKKYIQIMRYGQEHFYPTVHKITNEKMNGIRDYTEATGIGMGGIFLIFTLEPGIYQVHECVKLGRMRDYCILVDNGTYTEIKCPTTNDI